MGEGEERANMKLDPRWVKDFREDFEGGGL